MGRRLGWNTRDAQVLGVEVPELRQQSRLQVERIGERPSHGGCRARLAGFGPGYSPGVDANRLAVYEEGFFALDWAAEPAGGGDRAAEPGDHGGRLRPADAPPMDLSEEG
jgi:hypothetical protein